MRRYLCVTMALVGCNVDGNVGEPRDDADSECVTGCGDDDLQDNDPSDDNAPECTSFVPEGCSASGRYVEGFCDGDLAHSVDCRAELGPNGRCGPDVTDGAHCTDAPLVPESWTCDEDYYGANDGCDCGCGVVDLDCGDDTEDDASCEPTCVPAAPFQHMVSTAHMTKSTQFDDALNEVRKGTLTTIGASMVAVSMPGANFRCRFADLFETPLANGQQRTVAVSISADSVHTCELRYREPNTVTWTTYPVTAAIANVTVEMSDEPTPPPPGEDAFYAEIGLASVQLTGIETARLNAACAQLERGPISPSETP